MKKVHLIKTKLHLLTISMLCVLIQLYTLFIYYDSSFIVLIFIPILVVINYFMVLSIRNSFIHNGFWKSLFYVFLRFLFGTLIIKSFIVNIYPLSTMSPLVKVALYGLGWSLAGAALMCTIEYYLIRVQWQTVESINRSHKDVFRFSVPSIIIFTIVFSIYYPGIGSGDTVYIWDLIHNNTYTDTHPLMFLLLYKGLSILWDNIAVITLFQCIITAFAFGYTISYFYRKGLNNTVCWVLSFVLPLIPINAIYTITLWKDVPYSVGLMFFILQIIQTLEDNYLDKKKNMIIMVMSGLFVMFMRHNGFIPILGAIGLIGIYWLVKKRYKLFVKVVIIGISVIVLFFGIKNGAVRILNKPEESKTAEASISYDNQTIIPSVFPTTIAFQQIIYIEHYYGETFTSSQREAFKRYLKVDKLEQHKFDFRMGGTYGPNWEFYHKPYLYQRGIPVSELPMFWSFYFDIFMEHPVVALESYQKITSILWASENYGPTAYRGYTKDEFNIYVSSDYLAVMRPVREFLDDTIFSLYDENWIIFNRPAIYLLIIIIMCFIGFRRHGVKAIISFSPVLLNTLGYFIVITAQDVRYCYINMLTFIITGVYATSSIDVEHNQNM